MRDALERLDTLYPGMMLKFGGHAMAAGLSLEEDKFKLFQQRFGELVTEWLDPSLLQGEVVSDGPLSPAEMTMEVAQLLRDAGPWGQMFPEPLFDGHFRLLQQRLVGERHLKVMVEPVAAVHCWMVLLLMSIPPSGRITACAKCNWLISSISTSFAATAACKLSSTISGQFSVIFSIKKSVDWVQSRSYHRILTSSIKEIRPCLKLIR
ncbi:single-stranded DNA-specific exonuclease [Escherichia coli]|uniref:Single-stranded DNA-specific exonuclease n=1 Tax=Escherichia coli TaxID=562 RepID=A0A377C3N3_ECOLX|nr:single-stranded DNA-specific exonuclease [Escherichia coli]